MPPSPISPRFLPVGEAALTVEFGNAVAPELNQAVIALDLALAGAELEGVVETVPSYGSLLICYEPSRLSFARLVGALRGLLRNPARTPADGAAVWTVPVVYDPPYDDDVAEVAQRLGLTAEQVIALHCRAEYLVYTLGFAPGMPYLGGLPPALTIPRRPTPRPGVPAGAVMIGGVQACIVPIPMPSAWYTVGRTPLRPFDLRRADPFLFRPCDRLRFHRIDRGEFDRLCGMTTQALLPLLRAPA